MFSDLKLSTDTQSDHPHGVTHDRCTSDKCTGIRLCSGFRCPRRLGRIDYRSERPDLSSGQDRVRAHLFTKVFNYKTTSGALLTVATGRRRTRSAREDEDGEST